jgi:hypothetical protein
MRQDGATIFNYFEHGFRPRANPIDYRRYSAVFFE